MQVEVGSEKTRDEGVVAADPPPPAWTDHDRVGRWPAYAKVLWVATVVLLFAAYVFTNARTLSDGELPLDDAGTWGVATRPLAQVFTLPTEFHSQPPLYYLALHVVATISGGPWAMRGFSFLCGAALLAYVLFRARDLTPLSRVVFGLLFVTGELGRYACAAVRPYGMAALFATMSYLLFLRLLAAPSRGNALRYGLATFAALWTNAFLVTLLPVQGLTFAAVVLVQIPRAGIRAVLRQYRPALVALAGVALAYVPYLAMALHYQTAAYTTNVAPGRNKLPWSFELHYLVFRDYFQYHRYVLWGALALAALGFVGRAAKRRWDGILWLVVAVAQIVFVLKFIEGRTLLNFQTKYMLTGYLAACFLVALAFSILPRVVCRLAWFAAPIVVGYVAYTEFAAHRAYFAAPRPLGAYQAFHQHLVNRPGKKVVFFDIGYEGQRLEYQAQGDPNIVTATMRGQSWASGGNHQLDPGYVANMVEEHVATTACFYYVVDSWEGPYGTVFYPRMRALGYRPTSGLRMLPGFFTVEFCKP